MYPCWCRSESSRATASGQHAAEAERTANGVERRRRSQRHRAVSLRHRDTLAHQLRPRRQERIHVFRQRTQLRRAPLSIQTGATYAAFAPGHMLTDTSCIHFSPSTCFLYRVARLLLNTKGYKLTVTYCKCIVIMSPRYSLQVSRTSNLYPSIYMYPDTSCSSGIHASGRHVVLVYKCGIAQGLTTVRRWYITLRCLVSK